MTTPAVLIFSFVDQSPSEKVKNSKDFFKKTSKIFAASLEVSFTVADLLVKVLSFPPWQRILMGAPPIHHIPTKVNDSLNQELSRAETGNSHENPNPLKVRRDKYADKNKDNIERFLSKP